LTTTLRRAKHRGGRVGSSWGGLPLCRGARHRPDFLLPVLVTQGWEASGARGLVERLILPTCIASPLKQDEHPTPSGWGPRQDAPSALPCLVKRSRTPNFLVTGDITSGKRKMARKRKIEGDTWAPEEEARELLIELLGDVGTPIQFNNITGIHLNGYVSFYSIKLFSSNYPSMWIL
uniref:Large ribosomal subunit protein mL49 n=1 Tax=Apteryx owenii TaxID=8824 RepID=A0A8B9SC69_APTOW